MVQMAPRMQTRFPRPRGDGPDDSTYQPYSYEVSPPTRGWTAEADRRRTVVIGFPAHAGMDLGFSLADVASSGFPRPRGDGPVSPSEADVQFPVSPPTRGWTVFNEWWRWPESGFPAHAGMDRSVPYGRRCCMRFPRPRGDGPFIEYITSPIPSVSPPTRGWTVESAGLHVASTGFPAHAGMDPVRTGLVRLAPRFPRPRGDGPTYRFDNTLTPQVSPPTRGWTVGRERARPRASGFPAHARMDLEAQPEAPVLPVFGGRGRDGARGVGGLLPSAV